MEIIEFFESTKVHTTVVHVISVIFGMGSALVSDILFTFFSKDKKLNNTEINTLSILSKIVLASLFFIIISGLAIFVTDIDKYLNSAKFMSKMAIMAILLINGYILNNYIWNNLIKKDFFISNRLRSVRRLAFIAGSISVVSWVFVCILGIINQLDYNFYQIIFAYLIVILFASIASIFIESKKY